MANLEQKVNEEMKKSQLSGDKLRLETMRSLRAMILEFQKSGVGRDMNEEDEQKLLSNAAKKRKDAIELYKQANREDSLKKEMDELAIISEFLPKQMSEEELTAEVNRLLAEIGASEPAHLGKAMGVIMKELKGKGDGNLIQKLVKTKLGINV